MRGDAGILFALFVIALSASLPVGALYWLMRPMALPNPGISEKLMCLWQKPNLRRCPRHHDLKPNGNGSFMAMAYDPV
jgi:hypothetical protein